MNSIPGSLEVGSLYRLHDREERCLECLRVIHDDAYSKYSAQIRSTISGWTMFVHGTNIYEDGSIDWDFSTNGYWTDKDENGVLHERRVFP